MLKIESLFRTDAPQAGYDGIWIPARTERFHSIGAMAKRLWAVFRGKAEVVQWPEQRGEPIDKNGIEQEDRPVVNESLAALEHSCVVCGNLPCNCPRVTGWGGLAPTELDGTENETQSKTVLSPKDSEIFQKILENDEPNEHLVKFAQKFKRQAIVEALKRLTDEERLEVIIKFCAHCGTEQGTSVMGCRCWNDE